MMATYRKGSSTDLPLLDGTTIAVLGPLPEHMYDREEVGPMYRVAAVDGDHAGTHFEMFEDEIERDHVAGRLITCIPLFTITLRALEIHTYR